MAYINKKRMEASKAGGKGEAGRNYGVMSEISWSLNRSVSDGAVRSETWPMDRFRRAKGKAEKGEIEAGEIDLDTMRLLMMMMMMVEYRFVEESEGSSCAFVICLLTVDRKCQVLVSQQCPKEN